MPARTTQRDKTAVQDSQKNRFYLVKCEIFDRITFTAERGVLKRLSFAVSSKQSIEKGLQMVRNSPFQTVFVVDETTGSSIFAITQNLEFEAEAKKKPKKPEDPPPPPPGDSQCCQAAGCVDICMVDDYTCWCIDFGGQEPLVAKDRAAPFTIADPLESILAVLV